MAAESAVRILFLGDSAQAVRSVSRLESSFSSLHRTTRLLAGGLAVGLVGGLVSATKSALDFQRSMELIHTQAGASQVEVKKMSTALLGLAKSVGTTPEDLSKGLFHIESAGLRGSKALQVLKAAAEGAKVGQADLETTTNALVAAQKSGIAGAGSMQHAMAVLNATVGAGNMRMNDLAAAMGTGILAAASTFGISIQDVGAAIATMTTQGVHADEAATRLRMTFSLLAAPTSKAQNALKSVGLSADDLANTMRSRGLIPALQELKTHLEDSGQTATQQAQTISSAFGGGRTSAGIMILLGHIEDMRGRLAQINKTTGDFKNAWTDTTQTVSYKLDQAKASLEAAAIPIGNILLPALIKVAEATGAFANAVEQHMPQIRADFQAFGGIVSTVGSALGDLAKFALTPVGSAGLLSVLAGAGAYKTISTLSNLAIKAGEASTALTGVGLAGMTISGLAVPLAAGIGILAGALYASAAAGDSASVALQDVSDALKGLTASSQTYAQTGMALNQAQINVKTTALAVKDAQTALSKAIQDSGRNSEDARKAELALQQARLNHQQAIAQETDAVKKNRDAQKEQQTQIDQNKQALDRVRSSYQALSHFLGPRQWDRPNSEDSGKVQQYADAMNKVAAQAAAAARAIPATDSAAQHAAQTLQQAAEAAQALVQEMGRIPTQKQIDIYVRTHQDYGGTKGSSAPHVTGRAAGGFIPGPAPGAPVPILAHAGEVVLNHDQQQALGGPRVIASMFGFTGQEGPQFATGGFVSRRPRRAPHHPVRARYKTTSTRAKAALKGVDAINQSEADADRGYGQLVRQYQIADTDLQFVRYDDAGNAYLSQPDISQRVGEIDELIAARQHMLDLLAEEKKKLKAAIEDLRKAIAAMVKQIKEERKTIADLSKKMSAERRKKKPNQNVINKLQSQISAGGTRIGNLTSGIGEFQRAIGDQNLNLNHQLPFDVRDVQLDIATLLQERKDDIGTSLPTTSGGGATGGTTVAAPAGGGVDVSALIAEIARLNLALGIQTAQQTVIGSFAKGTLSVPETGLALVHAGEQIVPAGQVRGGSPVAPAPVHVEIKYSNGLEWLNDHVSVLVDGKLIEQGRKAAERARSGRY